MHRCLLKFGGGEFFAPGQPVKPYNSVKIALKADGFAAAGFVFAPWVSAGL